MNTKNTTFVKFNRKDLIKPLINTLGFDVPVEVISFCTKTATVTVQTSPNTQESFPAEFFELYTPYGEASATPVENILEIFTAVVEGKPIEIYKRGVWRDVKSPELLNYDKLIRVAHRIKVEPARERKVIVVDGVQYIEL